MATPSDLLQNAVSISSAPAVSDAVERAVISRGYYAAYHAAKDVKSRLLLPDPDRSVVGSHEKIFVSLTECTPGHTSNFLQARAIGLMALRVLKPYRLAADYFLDDQLPYEAKDETLARARVILEKSETVMPK